MFYKKEAEFLQDSTINEYCKEAKDKHQPRITNQELCEKTNISDSTLNNFLRGATKNPSVYLVGDICRALGASLDDYFDIPKTDSPSPELAEMQAKLESEQRMTRTYQESIRKKDALIAFLLVIVLLALGALLIDIMNPNVGWIRETAAITENHFCGEPTQEGARNELLYQVQKRDSGRSDLLPMVWKASDAGAAKSAQTCERNRHRV